MRVFAAAGLLLMAITLAALEAIAFLDPQGTKMADDADPFGDPAVSRHQHAVFILVVSFFVVVASRLIRKDSIKASRFEKE
jgi:hypothetical protein